MKDYTRIDPLTLEQEVLASEHYALVYHFLKTNKLDEDRFFDVVVFAYLLAVKKYNENDELQQYKFSTIAWWRMKAAVSRYWKSQFCAKHNAVVFSLDSPFFAQEFRRWDGRELERDDPAATVETNLMVSQVYARLNKRQRHLVEMRMNHVGDAEIAQCLHITPENLKRQIKQMQNLVADLI